jgi:predicted SAM-dependent methyltransferase
MKIIELGGGANPVYRPNVDIRFVNGADGKPAVDFTADFDKPLPIQSDEWDGVFSRFVIEHLSWRNVKGFLTEVLRILKEGGQAVFITANVEAQLEWIKNNPNGWDGKDAFESFSCVLFGDQTYPENTHKNYMNPDLLMGLLREVGFENPVASPFGDRKTDMHVVAVKPIKVRVISGAIPSGYLAERVPSSIHGDVPVEINQYVQTVVEKELKTGDIIKVGNSEAVLLNAAESQTNVKYAKTDGTVLGMILDPIHTKQTGVPREELFGKDYFNGGKKFGGYMREGYWDYPVHEITAKHILARNPSSVLEVGCARGYILKRIQDAGIRGIGIEISKHCYMTRVCDYIYQMDICDPTVIEEGWPGPKMLDLCYSVAVMEHIPEEHLKNVISEMSKHTKRGLHGIDFGEKDDGADKTHCTLRPKEWWVAKFKEYAPNWPVEIVDKEELEKGVFPEEVAKGDGKVKLNIGCHTVMYHHGWINMDLSDLTAFAQHYGYAYHRHDVRAGIPYNTASVDMIHCSHMLEHLTYDDGLKFLKECRRVLKDDGIIRVAVPDATLLLAKFAAGTLDDFAEISDEVAQTDSRIRKLHSLLYNGHQATYDVFLLKEQFEKAGFTHSGAQRFRESHSSQLMKEVLDMFPCLSIFWEGIPI